MKEDKVEKRIKELQKDSKFTFKLTNDIIALVYRIAVEDCSKEQKDSDKICKENPVIVSSSKELNKKFGSKRNKEDLRTYEDEDRNRTIAFKAKQEAYRDILNQLEKTRDLMDVYMYVKEMAKKTKYDEIKII